MRHRFTLVRLVAVLALSAMVGFMAMGCGDDTNPAQQDAGQSDVNTQQQDVAVQTDAPVQTDGPLQSDAAIQVDAANPGGNVIIVKASPQLTGNAGMDAVLGGIQLSYVVADWSPVGADQDVPTSMLDLRSGPFGCYAKYYNKGQVLDSGLTSAYLPSSGNAGDVTVEGYTKGSYYLGIADAGTPILMDFPDKITCKRGEIDQLDDAGVGTDAGTGRYEYACDNKLGGQDVPVTAFLAPGTDTLHVQALGGGIEVGPFDATAVAVAPFIKALPTGSLWALPNLVAAATDAGIPIGYACGDTDAGVDTAPCQQALAIQITWGDEDTAAMYMGANPPYTQERGKIVCSKVGAGNSFFIPASIWNAAFPNGNWRTITTFITHISVSAQHGMTTVVGAGGGQLGITHHP